MGRTRRYRKREIKLKKQTRKLGATQQKILLLLLGGFALACAQTPNRQWRIIRGMHEQWKDINKQTVERAIAALYETRLVESKDNADGTKTLVLSENGKKRALTYRIGTMKIPIPKAWDRKWRIVIFDIPEDEREVRDALREHLTRLGFFKLQQSVAAYPFDCKDEIDFIVEALGIRTYVRFIVAESVDNEIHLKQFFGLS